MTTVGQIEKKIQERVVKLFREQLDYDYLGDWTECEGNSNIEEDLLRRFLRDWKRPELNHFAIAEVLSDMDAELAALEHCRDKTCALKQGMMQELLTGRIRLV